MVWRHLLVVASAVLLVSGSASAEVVLVHEAAAASDLPKSIARKVNLPQSPYRGWDYLVEKLRADGIDDREIKKVYQSPKMPQFGPIYFSVRPRESSSIYAQFLRPEKLRMGVDLLRRYRTGFANAERQLAVSRFVIAAILLVETHGGRVLGSSLVINRLSRLAALSEPNNVELNYRKLKREDPSVDRADVEARAKTLDQMFYPELPALFEIAKKNRVNLLGLKGSGAGAFGIPQFLPTSYLQFALDGNGDQVVSLFDHVDAIWSAGNFLKAFGWSDTLSLEDRHKVILKYNNSDAYAEMVLKVAELLSVGAVSANMSAKEQPA